MYQGWIAEVGEVIAQEQNRIRVRGSSLESLEPGQAVALSGVSLCVEEREGAIATLTLTDETLRRSRFKSLRPGDRLNLEQALTLGAPIQGHLVQGHVEAVGKVAQVRNEGRGLRAWIVPPARFLERIEAKGSVAVDGVSLTVADKLKDRFSIALIPETLARTTLGELAPGHSVNLEADALTAVARRYAERPRAALQRMVAPRPWSGLVSGRTGVDKVLQTLAAGGVAVVWDPDTEAEGDVIAAGAGLKPETFVFFLTQACGHTTVPCRRDILERLDIPPMPGRGDRQGTAMHVPVDLAAATGTGVSAAERAATVRALADPRSRPAEFLRPGHVFPLGARPGLLSERQGHTEATVALMEAAGLPPVGICCELMEPDGRMSGAAELERFSLRWGLPMIAMDDLRRGL